jgi:hypothetical protein
MRALVAALIVLSASACLAGVARSKVIEQASFDHDCAQDKIQILEENTSIYAYRLNVCGTVRKYRDRGTYHFFEVTTDPATTPPPSK